MLQSSPSPSSSLPSPSSTAPSPAPTPPPSPSPSPAVSTMPMNTVLTALCCWEAMLERYQHKPTNPDPMSELWDNVGAYEMRRHAMLIAPWIDATHTHLEAALGEDALAELNMHSYDWEFCPLMLNFVVWGSFGIDLPPAEEVAARLVAAHTLLPNI